MGLNRLQYLGRMLIVLGINLIIPGIYLRTLLNIVVCILDYKRIKNIGTIKLRMLVIPFYLFFKDKDDTGKEVTLDSYFLNLIIAAVFYFIIFFILGFMVI